MITTGIIKEISEKNISVEIFDTNTPDDKSSCSSGNCAGCSAAGKGKLIKAVNSQDLPIKIGAIIEMEISSAKALIAGFRVLIVPLLLFITGFMIAGNTLNANEGLQVASGFTGLVTGLLFNILYSKKNRLKEMPEIVRIL